MAPNIPQQNNPRIVRPVGAPGQILDQFYDRENHKLRLGGIIGAVLGGMLGGHLVSAAGASGGVIAILGAVVMGGLGAWLGNRAASYIPHFGAAKRPTVAPQPTPTVQQPDSPYLNVDNQSLDQPDVTVPANLPRGTPNPLNTTVTPTR